MKAPDLTRSYAQVLLVEAVRVSTSFFIFLILVFSQILEPHFFNLEVFWPCYLIFTGVFLLHCFSLYAFDFLLKRPYWIGATMVIEAILISMLVYATGFSQSMFIFLYMILLICFGLLFEIKGSIVFALTVILQFTVVLILSPISQAPQALFVLGFNDVAFLAVSALSGYLSQQINFMGLEVERSGAQLTAIRNLHQLVVENIPSGLVTFLESGEILALNKVAKDFFKDTLSAKVFSLFPEKVQGLIRDSIAKQTQSQTTERFEVRFTNPEETQTVLTCRLSQASAPDTGQPVFMLIFDDETRFKNLEMAVRQSEKLAAVGQLAAGVAHEIRNPLAGISGSIQMLSGQTQSEEDKKLMSIVMRETDRLNNLITEFLDFSRPEKPIADVVPLAGLVEEILKLVAVQTNLRKDVQVDSQLNSQHSIRGDRDKLKQALLNIIINSYQAMESTPVAKFTVNLRDEDQSIVLSFKDSGIGMTEATKRRIFEPFHTTKPKGTGLGLAVTHKILENHMAQVQVESEPGKGSQFILKFPRLK